jgi:hypothetical protein
MSSDIFKLAAGLIALVCTSWFLGLVLSAQVFLSPWIVLIVLAVQFFFLFYLGLRDAQDS